MSDDDLAREVDRHAEQGAQLARTMDGHLAPPRDRLILSLVAENASLTRRIEALEARLATLSGETT